MFKLLIFKLHRDIAESILIIALWFWLESIGYPNLIFKVKAQIDTIINILANEAVDCLKTLEAGNPNIVNGGGLRLTKVLVEKDISIKIFIEQRYTVIAGIKSVLKNICAPIFEDILRIILKNNYTHKTSTSSRAIASKTPLVVPGFPHPIFGTFDIPSKKMNLDLLDTRIWVKNLPFSDVSDDDKAMFLTFSHGFPMSTKNVAQLIKSAYGDCVQSITLGIVDKDDQPLYAIMVLDSVEALDRILKGKRIANYQIGWKQIWACKYEPHNWMVKDLENSTKLESRYHM
ncbi:hypothetical protein TanjilG_23085 [Lupinus angustifolius]|uniref:RRM domain-containing protein n=2 Tax=Lupinus angustifolius TaxID=3871 RepID=A0A1J7GFZ3_LUPAN|nr:hypothetical protein TanjilG_23085 [Lupinus angustifolius]